MVLIPVSFLAVLFAVAHVVPRVCGDDSTQSNSSVGVNDIDFVKRGLFLLTVRMKRNEGVAQRRHSMLLTRLQNLTGEMRTTRLSEEDIARRIEANELQKFQSFLDDLQKWFESGDFPTNTSWPSGTNAELQRQLERQGRLILMLQSNLTDLAAKLADSLTTPTPPTTPLPTTPKYGECKDVSSFGNDELVTTRGGTQGMWCKDPMSDHGRVYYKTGYYNSRSLLQFPSEAAFKSNTGYTTYTLPVSCRGAQGQVVGGLFFCQDNSGPNVLVYNLTNVNSVNRISIPSAIVNNQCSYNWGGYSDIDIEYDESGLYFIYGRNGCSTSISKVNMESLTIQQTWQTDINKRQGQAFMICGKLYVVKSYSGNQYISDIFDTKTGRRVPTDGSLRFNNVYNYNSHTHYDPKDEALYIWDSGRQIRRTINWS